MGLRELELVEFVFFVWDGPRVEAVVRVQGLLFSLLTKLWLRFIVAHHHLRLRLWLRLLLLLNLDRLLHGGIGGLSLGRPLGKPLFNSKSLLISLLIA